MIFFLTLTVRKPLHRKDFQLKNVGVRGHFLKKPKLCSRFLTIYLFDVCGKKILISVKFHAKLMVARSVIIPYCTLQTLPQLILLPQTSRFCHQNPILLLSDSVCCTVENSVPNQYQQSSLHCLDLHENKVLISP